MSWPFYGLPEIPISHKDVYVSSESLYEDVSLSSVANRMQRFQMKILSLRALWNTEVPINKLPTELLVEILQYFQEAPPIPTNNKNAQPSSSTSNFAQWIPLMRVCRHWRAVACGNPRFWSTIRISRAASLQWFKLAVFHSGSAPLTLIFGWTPPPNDESYGLLVEHAAHIRHLRFSVVLPDWAVPTFSALIQAGMPSLHELTVDVSTPPWPGSAVSDTWLRISEGVTPHLSRLTLRYAYISWTPGLLANARCLHLTKCLHDPSPPFVDAFIAALRHAKRLEDMKLDGFLPSTTGYAPSRSTRAEPIELPSLRRLQLLDKPVAINLFLSRMRFHPDTHLSLTGQYERVSPDAPASFTSLIPRNAPVATSLSNINHVYYSTASAASRQPTVICRGRSKESCLDLNLACPAVISWDALRSPLVDLSTLLRDAPLSSLHIQRGPNAPEIPQAMWALLLDNVPSLERILAAGGSTSIANFFRALGSAATSLFGGRGPEGGGRARGDVQMGSLRCPQLCDVYIQDSTPYRDGLLTSVAQCLAWRAGRGAKNLKGLHLCLARPGPRGRDKLEAALKREGEKLAGFVDDFGYELWD